MARIVELVLVALGSTLMKKREKKKNKVTFSKFL